MAGVGKGADCAKTERQSHILEQMGNQEKNLDLLKRATAELLTRLIPALRDSEPSPDKESETVSPSLAPLAENLKKNNDQISYVVERINDAIDRLEL